MVQALETEDGRDRASESKALALRVAPHPDILDIVNIAPAFAGQYAEVEVVVDGTTEWALWEDDQIRPKDKGKGGERATADGSTKKIAFITGHRLVQLTLSGSNVPHDCTLSGILLSRTLTGKKALGKV